MEDLIVLIGISECLYIKLSFQPTEFNSHMWVRLGWYSLSLLAHADGTLVFKLPIEYVSTQQRVGSLIWKAVCEVVENFLPL